MDYRHQKEPNKNKQPLEPVDEAADESFPASDPPSFTSVNGPGRPQHTDGNTTQRTPPYPDQQASEDQQTHLHNGQSALITGASSGIGRALAVQFAAAGYKLVMIAEDEQLLAQAAAEINEQYGVAIKTIAKDLTQPSAAREIHEQLVKEQFRIDVLVNNAGVGQREIFHETDIEKDLNIVRLNIEALLRMTKLFIGDMVDRGAGKILNLGSIAGFQPGPLMAVYHASKAFVVSFSEALWDELKDTGVTITVLCPGPTDTDFFRRADMENARVLEDGIVMDPEEVARIGFEGLMAEERIVIPGMSNKIMTFSRRLIPSSLQAAFHRKMYEVKVE